MSPDNTSDPGPPRGGPTQAFAHTDETSSARERELHLITSTTPLILAHCGRDLKYRYVNRAAASLFGLEPEQMIGRLIVDVMGPQAFALIKPRIDQVLGGERVEFEAEIPYASGSRWLHVVYEPERDAGGDVVGWIASVVDMSAKRRVDMRQQQELERRVEERTSALNATYERLRMAERLAMLGTLSAGLGHDMGNLLVPIRIRLESLADSVQSEQGKEDLAAIRTSVEYLRRLAKGLRLLAVDPAPASSSNRTELAPWWIDAQGVLASVLPRGVMLTAEFADPDLAVRMSRAALTQAVFNLVQNAGDALKGRGSGNVRIHARREGEDVLLTVTDDGRGMDPEVRARCMEPYFSTKHQGISTGLGLALVNSLVRDAGGAIEVRSAPAEGTSFTLRLPVVRPERLEGMGPALVACVEIRDPRLRSFVTGELRTLRFEVRSGVDGAAALCVLDIEDKLNAAGEEAMVVFLGEAADLPARVRALGAKPGIWAIREALIEAARVLHTSSKAPADGPLLKVVDGTG